ncbi:MAG: UxaA family hydrolase [Desulfobacterales bacterium]
MQFSGYRREDGRVGARNHVVVMASVSCVNGVVEAIGRALPEAVVIANPYGCGYGPEDITTSITTLSGVLDNPNVGAGLVIGLGCEVLAPDFLIGNVMHKPLEKLVVQEAGGSAAVVEKGVKTVAKFLKDMKRQQRETVPVRDLIIGLECGGSDAFSGISANPAVGVAADRFVHEGATVILSETTEMIGTAHILKRRCATADVGLQVEKLVNDHEQHVRRSLGELAGMVISPGNIDGGLSSITEKSLGCIMKGGTTPITQVVEYAKRPSASGLVIMDTPGYDIDSMAGMAAGGAQIIIFTTGRGSIAGFPAVPVVKVASNSRTFTKMAGDMDVNAGGIIDGEKTIDEVGNAIFDACIQTADGELTCAEKNRTAAFNYLKQGPTF